MKENGVAVTGTESMWCFILCKSVVGKNYFAYTCLFRREFKIQI
jgi:hypothetical protein